MQNLNLSLIILVVGLVVVFVMLALLTFIIKIYSTIIHKAKNKTTNINMKPDTKTEDTNRFKLSSLEDNQNALPGSKNNHEIITDELVAVISAAVYTSLLINKNYKIKKITKVAKNRTEWGRMGIIENTRVF